MDKIKRFIDCGIGSFSCNFRCHYCYVTQNYLFTQKVPKIKYSAEQVGKALTKERLGGPCMFNICASGETLIPDYVVDYTKAILSEGHYVMIVTNGTLRKRFQEFATFPNEYLKRLFFKISFHYLELKKRNMLDSFFENVELIKNMKVSFTIEITPTDELVPYIDEIKELSIAKLGAWPHITVARDESKTDYPLLTNYNIEEYKKIWGSFDSMMFNYKMSVFGRKRKEYCYAGNWSFTLNLLTGMMKQCYQTNFFANIFKNPEKPLKFINIGHGCKAPHCHNAHAFLCFGSIPEMKTPYYAELRNRVCTDGTEWLQPEMKAFMSTKMGECNEQVQPVKDIFINQMYNVIYHVAMLGRSLLKRIDYSYKSNERRKNE